MATHYRSLTDSAAESKSEDLSDQIDRLNQALAEVMKEIEVSSCSRNPSRLSVNPDLYTESVFQTEESEDRLVEDKYESTIELLIHTIDRQQMIIEDYSADCDRREKTEKKDEKGEKTEKKDEKREKVACGHDLNRIRKEIWLQVKMQKNEQSERERLRFEQELVALDDLKDDYYKKRSEILLGIEKLKIKEQLLEAKEKELRSQRLIFEKQKLIWDQEHGIESKPALLTVPKPTIHNRSSSFSPNSKTDPPRPESKPKHLPMEVQPEQYSPTKHEQLKQYQSELKDLESQKNTDLDLDSAEREMRIETLRNKIAALRGEIAISESNKTTRLFNSVIVSIQREVNRDEKQKAIENNASLPRNLINRNRNSAHVALPVKPRPLEVKVEDFKKQGVDVNTPKGLLDPNREIDEIYLRKKVLLDKEKEIAQREALLQQTWMRIPGGKELIENVNLTLAKLQSEKNLFEKEKEEFNKERMNWIINAEKNRRK